MFKVTKKKKLPLRVMFSGNYNKYNLMLAPITKIDFRICLNIKKTTRGSYDEPIQSPGKDDLLNYWYICADFK